MRGPTAALFVMMAVAACGDPNSRDTRGYTKAPLENPGLRIVGEPSTRMDALGEPQLPPVVDIPAPPDTTGGGQAGG